MVRINGGNDLILVAKSQSSEGQYAGWVLGLFWGQSLFWIKLSLLLFYRRIFSVGSSKVKFTIWAVMAYLVCIATISLFEQIFQCLPVHYLWDVGYAFVGKVPPTKGSCPNLVARGVLIPCFDLVSDIFILVLPMVGLRGLQIPMRQKITVAGVFALGASCCVVTIVRIPDLRSSELSVDPSWDNAYPILFTVMEPDRGVLCACLLCLPPLFRARRKRIGHGSSKLQGSEDNRQRNMKRRALENDFDELNSRSGINSSRYIPLNDLESSNAPK